MPVTNSAYLPLWWVWPSVLVMSLGIYGLVRGIGWAIRMFNPTKNAFTISASQKTFRFVLTKRGTYEIGCVRPNQFSYFQVPKVALVVRLLPMGSGQEQWLHAGGASGVKRTNMSGETTMRIGTFEAYERGEYELLNPDAGQFKPGDKLSIMPNTGFRTVLLVLVLIVSGFATIGGLMVGILALAGR